jgi:hypothetical protein
MSERRRETTGPTPPITQAQARAEYPPPANPAEAEEGPARTAVEPINAGTGVPAFRRSRASCHRAASHLSALRRRPVVKFGSACIRAGTSSTATPEGGGGSCDTRLHALEVRWAIPVALLMVWPRYHSYPHGMNGPVSESLVLRGASLLRRAVDCRSRPFI